MMTTFPPSPGISDDMATGLVIVAMHKESERDAYNLPPGPEKDRADGIAEGIARALGVMLSRDPAAIRARVRAHIEQDLDVVERARRALASTASPPEV